MNSTENELKQFWKRTGLSFLGHRFEDDIKNPSLAMCMRNGIECLNKKHKAPMQNQINFNIGK